MNIHSENKNNKHNNNNKKKNNNNNTNKKKQNGPCVRRVEWRKSHVKIPKG